MDKFKTSKPQLLEQINKGSFGEIYKVQWQNQIFAAKIIPREKWGTNMLFECMISKSFCCPYLSFADKILVNNNYIILSELAITDLADYKSKNEIPIKLLWRWIKQLLIGIYTLHSNGIIHADIKAKNILVMPDKTIKLTDYSCSCFSWLDNKGKNSYTYTHRPPEVWLEQNWNESADIWALGCTIFEIVVGDYIFPAQKKQDLKLRMLACINEYSPLSNVENIENFKSDHYPYHQFDILNKPEYSLIKEMIMDCLISDNKKRLNVKELLEKYYFNFPVNNFLSKFDNYPLMIENIENYLDMESGYANKLGYGVKILLQRLPPKEQTKENIVALCSLVSKLLGLSIDKTINENEDNVCRLLNFHLYFNWHHSINL